MKRLASFGLLLITLVSPAFAVGGEHVKYVGGTVPSLNAGGMGRLDTTSDNSLTFEYSGKKAAIPYADIQSFEYSQEVARHLGVLPTIAVALFKVRQHKHFFRISYHDQNQVPRVAVFEVPKHMVRVLQAVLSVQAPHSCEPCSSYGGPH